ncbi:putative Ig-like domain-containing protein [Seiridium cardinale]|uniref:Ig-like domain-containing protein n=1 Tax=Seiridium cardinale TaxID=138064 RepID=A0ABR2XNV6_9PEZI
MAAPSTSLAALTTVFTPPPLCADRYAVFVGSPTPIGGSPSTYTPSSGWIDPSFTTCNPPQYTNTYPTFSPGVCPAGMNIVASTSDIDGTRTVWTGACCERLLDPQYLCTSSVTTPMGFLLDPNISTADIYTTMSNLYVEHDQLTVLWEETDLPILPASVAAQYASIMGVATPTPSSTTAMNTTLSMQSPGVLVTPQPTPAISSLEIGDGTEATTADSSTVDGTSQSRESSAVQVTSSLTYSSTSRNVVRTVFTQWFVVFAMEVIML